MAVKGWTEGAGALADVLARFDGRPVDALVVTQIAVDGTGDGPDLDLYRELLDAGATGDARRQRRRRLARRTSRRSRASACAGVIVGQALYEGAFTVEEAFAACASPG